MGIGNRIAVPAKCAGCKTVCTHDGQDAAVCDTRTGHQNYLIWLVAESFYTIINNGRSLICVHHGIISLYETWVA
jgi:hypothetical protein